jgi:DNA/RNA endonuclease YhcR with UshA esterase domain
MRALGVLLASAVVLPLVAHHSIDAEFDRNKPVTVTGTVTKIDWMNPHIWIYLDVKNKDGQVEKWQFEGGPPNALKRSGWNRDSLKVGDQVTISGILAKVNVGLSANTGNAQSVMLPDGRRVLAGQADNAK